QHASGRARSGREHLDVADEIRRTKLPRGCFHNPVWPKLPAELAVTGKTKNRAANRHDIPRVIDKQDFGNLITIDVANGPVPKAVFVPVTRLVQPGIKAVAPQRLA